MNQMRSLSVVVALFVALFSVSVTAFGQRPRRVEEPLKEDVVVKGHKKGLLAALKDAASKPGGEGLSLDFAYTAVKPNAKRTKFKPGELFSYAGDYLIPKGSVPSKAKTAALITAENNFRIREVNVPPQPLPAKIVLLQELPANGVFEVTLGHPFWIPYGVILDNREMVYDVEVIAVPRNDAEDKKGRQLASVNVLQRAGFIEIKPQTAGTGDIFLRTTQGKAELRVPIKILEAPKSIPPSFWSFNSRDIIIFVAGAALWGIGSLFMRRRRRRYTEQIAAVSTNGDDGLIQGEQRQAMYNELEDAYEKLATDYNSMYKTCLELRKNAQRNYDIADYYREEALKCGVPRLSEVRAIAKLAASDEPVPPPPPPPPPLSAKLIEERITPVTNPAGIFP